MTYIFAAAHTTFPSPKVPSLKHFVLKLLSAIEQEHPSTNVKSVSFRSI